MIRIHFDAYKKAINDRLDDLTEGKNRAVTPTDLRAICHALAIDFIDAASAKVDVPRELAENKGLAAELKKAHSDYELALAKVFAERGYYAVIDRVREMGKNWTLHEIVETFQSGFEKIENSQFRKDIYRDVNSDIKCFTKSLKFEDFQTLATEAGEELSAALHCVATGVWSKSPKKSFEKISQEVSEAHSFALDIARDPIRFNAMLPAFVETMQNEEYTSVNSRTAKP